MSPTTPTRLFGTDGIRGVFGQPPLTRGEVTALGFHLAAELGGAAARPLVVLGGDTRDSTPELCGWLAAGLAAGGAVCRFAGVIPTPGVALLARRLEAAAGVAVSASHNPHPDNGIKLIDGGGFKWDRERERALEARFAAAPAAARTAEHPPLAPEPSLAETYLAALAATLPADRPLASLRIVLDAANGAAAPFAGPLFTRLGAEVTVLGDRPDGRNINRDGGSTRPAAVAAATAAGGFDLGIAFDGDADRAVLADERGAVRDGDAILYLWASALAAAGELEPPRIVATSMSNLGLELALSRRGVAVERCPVGDREVVDAMRRGGLLLGGEQSGHVVHLGLATTGDGMLTALQMARLRAASGRPLSELLADFTRYPQILRNVRVRAKPELASLPQVQAAARGVERRLGAQGRLVLRYSGTEPLARIMIEGPDRPTIDALAEELAGAIERELG